jgi:hypothetical protein
MKLRALCVAVVGAAAMVSSAGPATAATPTDPSTVEIGDIFNGVQAVGTVTSPNAGCIANRTVEIYAIRPEGAKLFDVDQTSRRGYWSGGGPKLTTGAKAVRVKVLAKTVGPKSDERRCAADTDSVGIE